MSQPNDYGQPSQYIIELYPKLLAWAVGILQIITLGVTTFVLLLVIELKAEQSAAASDVKALAQRIDRSDSRQDRFDERLGRVEVEGRR